MAAPKVSEMGGGIGRAAAGKETQTYVDYFEGDNAAGMSAGKRKANYTDVVNKCVGYWEAEGVAVGGPLPGPQGPAPDPVPDSRTGTTILPPASTSTAGAWLRG